MADRTRAVAKDLYFDMACSGKQLLDIHVTIAKRLPRFRLTSGVSFFHFLGMKNGSHPTTAATTDGFNHHRATVAQGGEKRTGLLKTRRFRGSLQYRNTTPFSQCSRL